MMSESITELKFLWIFPESEGTSVILRLRSVGIYSVSVIAHVVYKYGKSVEMQCDVLHLQDIFRIIQPLLCSTFSSCALFFNVVLVLHYVTITFEIQTSSVDKENTVFCIIAFQYLHAYSKYMIHTVDFYRFRVFL